LPGFLGGHEEIPFLKKKDLTDAGRVVLNHEGKQTGDFFLKSPLKVLNV
jgi:hypothetical protein